MRRVNYPELFYNIENLVSSSAVQWLVAYFTEKYGEFTSLNLLRLMIFLNICAPDTKHRTVLLQNERKKRSVFFSDTNIIQSELWLGSLYILTNARQFQMVRTCRTLSKNRNLTSGQPCSY